MLGKARACRDAGENMVLRTWPSFEGGAQLQASKARRCKVPPLPSKTSASTLIKTQDLRSPLQEESFPSPQAQALPSPAVAGVQFPAD
jgi:hypothetical protein